MDRFTFEEKNTGIIYETFEWDRTWIEHTPDTKTPRVLYIGDSISAPTRGMATAAAEHKIFFDGFHTSKAVDNPVFKETLRLFTKQIPHVDAILFNNGLHGWHLDDESEYAEYYESFVKFLLEEYKVPTFIVLTTFVNKDYYERVKVRNAKALEIAEKYSLPVIDFHSASLENKHLIAQDNVHFTDPGYEILAGEAVKAVKELF